MTPFSYQVFLITESQGASFGFAKLPKSRAVLSVFLCNPKGTDPDTSVGKTNWSSQVGLEALMWLEIGPWVRERNGEGHQDQMTISSIFTLN